MKYIILIGLLAITACSAKMMKTNNPTDIKKALIKGEDIIIEGITFEDELDLTEILPMSKSSVKTSFGQVRGNIYFQECIFKKPFTAFKNSAEGEVKAVQFQGNVGFVNCKFEDEFTIRYCSVEGNLDFSGTTFRKKANFQDVIFMQRVNFKEAFWADEALFQNTRFYHRTNFMDIKVDGHLMFQSANFRDETNFSLSECLKYVDFSLVRFDGPALFNYIKWKDRAVFNNALWNMDSHFVEPEFGDVSFKNSTTRGKFMMQGEKISGKHITAEI